MTATVFFGGEFMPAGRVSISPLDRGWLLGDGVYEVTPLYEGRCFELERHMQRLARSLRETGITEPAYDWPAIVRELVERNDFGRVDRATCYMQITRGVAPRSHAFPNPSVAPSVYASVAPFPSMERERGCAAILVSDVRWSRCDIKSISLMANCIANQRAHDHDAYEAIFVRDGMLLEGTHTNVFAVLDGVVCTAPLTNYILPGITREIVLEICRESGIPARERPLAEQEIERAEEIFLTGTSTEVLGVVRLDGAPVGDGKVGSVTQRLRRLYSERALARSLAP